MTFKKAQNKLNSQKALVFTILCMFMFSFFIFGLQSVSALDTSDPNSLEALNSCQMGQVYLDGKGCITPKFNVDYKVYPQDSNAVTSSLGEVQAIRINNPYAAAGQPVIVEFTLQNIGDQVGYPFDKIDLPADVFALQLAVDKDIGVIMADGRRVDVWGMMTGWQRVGFLLQAGGAQFGEEVVKTLQGRTCGYVEISKYLPNTVQTKLQDMNGGNKANVYTWECIKIVDYPLFKTQLSGYCPDGINSACISRLNKNVGNSVSDVVTVLLSSGTKSNIARGTCERPNSGTFWKSFGGYLAGNVNVVECAIGENGLKPGESVTFKFVALVPADAPVLNPQALQDLTDIKKTDGALFGGYTESASCIDSSNPKACHTVYGAVFPVSQDNLISWLADKGKTVLDLLGCSGKELWTLGKASFGACMANGHGDVDVVGDPIWEGQGIFYVLGPALSATITMILWGAAVAGALSPFTGRKI